jgi:hypothetical protein
MVNQNFQALTPEALDTVKKRTEDFYDNIFGNSERKEELMKIVKTGIEVATFNLCECYQTLFENFSYTRYYEANRQNKDLENEGFTKITIQNSKIYFVKIEIFYTDPTNCFLYLVHEIGHLLEISLRPFFFSNDSKEDISLYFELRALQECLKDDNNPNKTICELTLFVHLMRISLDLAPPSLLSGASQSPWLMFRQTIYRAIKTELEIFNCENDTILIGSGLNHAIELNPYVTGIVNAARLLRWSNLSTDGVLNTLRDSHASITLPAIWKAVELLQSLWPNKNE